MSIWKFGLKAQLQCVCGKKLSTEIGVGSYVVNIFKENIDKFIDEHKNCEKVVTKRDNLLSKNGKNVKQDKRKKV